ncbi:RHS repeat-associated core domain-containing protein [Desulfogranum japonicum]|uniref:RHS repeat-associated core domain-containing protein n=1 Tax=Desulfogranum japonicum TaxID=231447 RepID=UPI0003F8798C|nr:RHS repeat-associated core domain-containing protein [Desulfogranum japonicum]
MKTPSQRTMLHTILRLTLLLLFTCSHALASVNDCGLQSLAHLLKLQGSEKQAQAVLEMRGQLSKGQSVSDLLRIAETVSLPLQAYQVTSEQLAELDLPVIVHLKGKPVGHFTVLQKIEQDTVQLYDGSTEHITAMALANFRGEYNNIALSTDITAGLPILSRQSAATIMGGHASATPVGDSNSPKPDDDKCPKGNTACCNCGNGSPVWAVNPVDLNLYVRDLPLRYDPALGPSVNLTLNYSNKRVVRTDSILGNKWNLGYRSYVTVDDTGNVTIIMPGGRKDTYTKNDDGTFQYAYQRFDTLTQQAKNQYKLTLQSGIIYHYQSVTANSNIFLSAITDQYGHHLTLDYTGDLLTSLTDEDGNTTTLQYNEENLLEQVNDPFGRNVRFTYNSDQYMTSITDMGGFKTQMEYDSNGYLSALVNAGSRTEFNLERNTNSSYPQTNYPAPGAEMSFNKRLTITHPDGGKEEFHYVAIGAYAWRVLPEHYQEYTPSLNNSSTSVPKTLYYFTNTNQGREISSITYPNGERRQFTYDSTTGQKLSESDASGSRYTFTYTDKGRMATIKEPDNQVTTLTYADNGVDVVNVSNGLGEIILEYNTTHDVTKYTDLAGNRTTASYNGNGQIRSITNALNQVTSFIYGSDNRLARVERDSQVLAEYSYDAKGRLTSSEIDGMALSYTYDNLDHLTSVTYPDGKKAEYEYNSLIYPHLLTKSTERSGITTDYIYNGQKLVERAVNNEGGIERFLYGKSCSTLAAFIDPNSNQTSFEYDTTGNLVSKTYADGHSQQYTYNNRGLVETSTNARGINTRYYYNRMGNLLTIDHQDQTPDVSFTYDTYNRLTTIVDGSGTTTLTYNDASQLATVDGPWEDDTITYTYDELGRLQSLTPQGGQTQQVGYDTLGRLEQIQTDSQVFSYGYKGNTSLIESLTRPGDATTTYSYDAMHRLTGVENTGTAGVFNATTFTYNNQDQRDSETLTGGLPLPSQQDLVTEGSFNMVNQLLATTNPDQDFVYDYDGNLVEGYTREGYRFQAEYDAFNRLHEISYTDADNIRHRTVYTYRFDSFLAKIQKFEGHNLVDETHIVRHGRLALQDRDTNNTVLREYTWGKNFGGGIGGLINIASGGENYHPLYDGKGNIIAVLDANQQQVAQYRYNTFGQLVSQSGDFEQPFTFSTKRYDSGLGLVYYGYRFYYPAQERWLNRDPLGEEGGINLYGFVGGNPVNWIDPWGLKTYDGFWDNLFGVEDRMEHYRHYDYTPVSNVPVNPDYINSLNQGCSTGCSYAGGAACIAAGYAVAATGIGIGYTVPFDIGCMILSNEGCNNKCSK